ncbi:lactonase family protein [Microlunatus flavus]|uniref:6-phosphogluconolactonase, cycloisomerase 2 family n=1 Tax=Microlunatus flavus TaxID=1036181 RepID=A0A1H9A7J4_9ACTN|nr:beta-propeller fold lactonase family protein [Microlunatus flavus]SEP72624.1 6-phosphogluconolactonase, cycloisomerase 2 family [Microlunatus flavus]
MGPALLAVGGDPTPDGRGGLRVLAVRAPDRGVEDATLEELGTADTGTVSYLAVSRSSHTLYVASQLDDEPHLTAFRWSDHGALELLRRERVAAGAAHLCVTGDGRHLLSAEYGSGSVSVFRVAGGDLKQTDEVRFDGSGPHPRQESPHPHQVLDVGGAYVVPDLGTDLVHRFVVSDEGRLEHRHAWNVPAGSGPRHAVVVHGTLFVACELSGEVRWGPLDGGAPLDGVVRSSSSTAGEVMPSAIGVHQGRILVANRGPGTILSVLASPEGLTDPRELASGGTWPRDFTLVGDHLAVADPRDDRLRLVGLRDPHPIVAETSVPAPTCVVAL